LIALSKVRFPERKDPITWGNGVIDATYSQSMSLQTPFTYTSHVFRIQLIYDTVTFCWEDFITQQYTT